MEDKSQQQGPQESLDARAEEWWERLVAQIRHDAAEMNAGGVISEGWPILKGKIEINGRELLPRPLSLHIDRLPFPGSEDGRCEPIYFAIQLDIDEGSLKTINNRTRGAYVYGRGKNENCSQIVVSQVHLVVDNDRVSRLIHESGRELDIEQFSKSILLSFVIPPFRCGSR